MRKAEYMDQTDCESKFESGKGADTTSLNNFHTNYRNVPKFSDTGNFAEYI